MITNFETFKRILERSEFDSIANIGKIKKQIEIELDLKHSMHSKERQGRSSTYIKDADIKMTVEKATEQIIELMINDTLSIGDPVLITDKETNLNVVGTLLNNKINDNVIFRIITVMITDSFYNKNKTYQIFV